MTTLKIKTAKGYTCVILNNEISIVQKGDQLFFYPNISNGTPCDDQTGTEPFIEAYNAQIQAKQAKRQADIEIAQEKELQRIADLKERIANCDTPKDLAEEFDLATVELASHWSDCHEGRSRLGILISSRAEDEIMSLAIDIHDADGDYGEARHRAGEHHSTFSGPIYSLDEYQKGLKRHFNGDKYFYKSQEVDKDFYCEQIAEAAGDNDMNKAQDLIKSFNDIEAGYYDCNGSMQMPEATLESDEITGYDYDVYSFSFCYRFNIRYNNWKEVEELEEQEV